MPPLIVGLIQYQEDAKMKSLPRIKGESRLARRARAVFSAALPMTLFAACAPALAHGDGVVHQPLVPVAHTNTGLIGGGAPSGIPNNLTHPHSQFFAAQPSATQVSTSVVQVNLDLSPSVASITLPAGLIAHGASATIDVGGVAIAFKAGDQVTPAELVAISQAQRAGGRL